MTVRWKRGAPLAADWRDAPRLLPPDEDGAGASAGQPSVTPDSLGPRTAERVLVTRHMGDCRPTMCR